MGEIILLIPKNCDMRHSDNIIQNVLSINGRGENYQYNKHPQDWAEIKQELFRFNIRALLIKTQINQDTKLIYPFIIRNKEGEYTLIEESNKNGLKYKKGGKSKFISYNIFTTEFDQEIMLTEISEYIPDISTKTLKDVQIYIAIVVFLMLGASMFYTISSSTRFIALQSLNIVGVVLSLAYFMQEYKVSNIVFNTLCGGQNKFNCNVSNEHNYLGVNHSSLGLIYFTTSLFALILDSDSLPNFYVLISVIGLLGIFRSLFLQIFVIKKVLHYLYRYCICVFRMCVNPIVN